MKALVRVPGGVAAAERPEPRPAPEEVIVAVHSCGICGSDVHAAEASFGNMGGIPGHEFSGTIAELGSDVDGWRAGQAVAVNPLGSCGTCEWCQRELLIRCPNKPDLGLSADGGFAEYVAVHQSQLFALPDGMPVDHGSRVEPLAVALRAIVEAQPGRGNNAIVYGVGPIGLHLILALRAHDAGTIVAVGRKSAGRRDAAAACGADVVLDSRTTDVVDYVREAGLDIHQGYECSADRQALVRLSHAVRIGGTLSGLALGSTPSAFDTHSFVAKGQRMFGSCAYGNREFAQALELIASRRIDVEPLISERVPLDDGSNAFVRLRTPEQLIAILVQPWRA
ncbi:MAG TPA: alcohol dehydrogenase catalytic domain-containing protein [Chloroflexota bacterium]|jgi:threonine dehydrogenase-like Zn-dependent dehydrogenase|nr:alcohol dehydrogenase catalytic domain-containing protein [Chloroflexota bacterium]